MVNDYNLFDEESNKIFAFENKPKGNKKGLQWDLSEMMIIKFKQKIALNPSFSKVFIADFNITRSFRKEIELKTTGEKNIILEVAGQTGSGKSMLVLTIATKWMKKNLMIEDICFTNALLLDRASSIGKEEKKSHVLIQDEQTFAVGVGSDREKQERQTLEDTVRKFGLSIIFCSPTIQGHTTAHYSLEVICINKKLRLTKVGVLYNNIYLGYFVIKVLSEKNKLWVAYNKSKDEFIQNILSRSNQRLSLDDMSRSIEKHPQYKYCTTSEDLKVVTTKMYPTLTGDEIRMIITNHKLMRREHK